MADPLSAVDPKYLVKLSGKFHPTYQGVLQAAYAAGMLSLEAELVQAPTPENGNLAICAATATFPGTDGRDRVFTELGDCDDSNCGPLIKQHKVRMAACVPLSAQILTRFGWQPHNNLVVGQDVLAYDCKNDMLRWTPLRAVTVYADPHPTVRMSSRSASFVCTPDHSWAARRHDRAPRLVRTCDLGPGQSIVQAAVAEGGDSSLSPRLAAVLGWLATDGNVRESMVTDRWGTFGPYLRATIYQSKEQYLPILRELLGGDASELTEAPKQRDFSFMGGKVSDCKRSYRWQLKSGFLRDLYRAAEIEQLDQLPSLVMRMSQPARSAMLEAMMQAEGSHRGGGRWIFYQRKPWVMEAFVLLATLEGRALGASSSKGVRWDSRVLRSRRLLTASYLLIEPEKDQPVWCPTTDYGTWVMQQDGMVCITGNTRAKGRALRDALGIGVALKEEMGADNDREDREESTQSRADGAPPRAEQPRERAAEPLGPAPSTSSPQAGVVEEQPARADADAAKVCGTCGVALTDSEIDCCRQAGSPPLCTRHAAGKSNRGDAMECSNPGCRKPLTRGQYEVSRRSYGQPLCPACQKQFSRIGL